jgi:signal recognition particle subunit SRP54
MGSLGKILGMLPGRGDMKEQLDQVDDRELDRVSAIIQSMTPGERADPKILNGSRRARIARGSGTQVSDVNGLIERFGEAQKMMRQMGKGGGMPGMPGAGGMPGMPGAGGKKSKGKMAKQTGRKAKKGRSGNPAKRAAQEAGAADGSSSSEALEASDSPQMPDMTPPDMSQLPDDLKKLLS